LILSWTQASCLVRTEQSFMKTWPRIVMAAALCAICPVPACSRTSADGSEQRAAALRDEAFAACDMHLWADCLRKLDAAKKLDPDGDSDSRVSAARDAVVAGLKADQERPKPKPR
jgi:hypothetical protein